MELNSTLFILTALGAGCLGWWACYAVLGRKPKPAPEPTLAEQLRAEIDAAERNRLVEDGHKEKADSMARYWTARRDRLQQEVQKLSTPPAVQVAEMPEGFRRDLALHTLAAGAGETGVAP